MVVQKDLLVSDERLQHIVRSLKGGGHNVTPQRLAIVRILAISDKHYSAEEILDQIKPNFPTTSLATVYKTVNLLKGMGEVLELDLGGPGKRFDGRHPSPHPHLVCTACNRVFDLEIAALEELKEEAERKTGFTIENQQVTFLGHY